MLKTAGSISLGRILMIVKVLKSKATLVPTFNLLVSIAFLHVTTYLGPFNSLMMTFFYIIKYIIKIKVSKIIKFLQKK